VTSTQYKWLSSQWERLLDKVVVTLNHRLVVDTITTRFFLLFLFLLSIPLMTVIFFTVGTFSKQLDASAREQVLLTRNLYAEGINHLLEKNQLPNHSRIVYGGPSSPLEINLLWQAADHPTKQDPSPTTTKPIILDNTFLNQLYQRHPTLQTEIWILSVPHHGESPHWLAKTSSPNSSLIAKRELLEALNSADLPQDETFSLPIKGVPYQLSQCFMYNAAHEKIARRLIILPMFQQQKVLNDYYLGIYLIAVASLLFSVLLAMIAGRTITQPLLKLIRQVDTTSRESVLKNQGAFKIDGVAEIRQLAEAFNRLVSRLKQEQTLRDEFVATLTHDLKVPMLAEKQTLAYFQKETYGTINEEQGEVLDVLRSSNVSCLALVNGLLEVYRYDSGSARLMPQSFNLTNLLHKTVTELMPLAQEKGVTLTLDIELPDNELQNTSDAFADRLEIQRVLHNLISNAITNTPRYGEISCRLSDASANGRQFLRSVSHFKQNTLSQPLKTENRLLLSIADTGVGFTQEDLPTVFTQFAASRGRNPMSIGLGLYNCHQVICAHNSVLWVESSEGEGSVISFLLPRNSRTFYDRRIRHERRQSAD
jgi:signal transduction histidine kinase